MTHRSIIQTLVLISMLCAHVSWANDGNKPTEKDLETQSHSIQYFLIPTIVFNSLTFAYEYKINPQLGLRLDSGVILSIGGSALAGAFGLSYLVAEGRSDNASHGLELDLGVGGALTAPGNCDTDVNDCDNKSFLMIRGFVGYRYQKYSGFQFRLGLAPLVSFEGDAIVLPEITLGTSF